MRTLDEVSKRGFLSKDGKQATCGEPYHTLQQEQSQPPQKRRDPTPRTPVDNDQSETSISSDADVPPRHRRPKRSPTPPWRKRSSSKEEEDEKSKPKHPPRKKPRKEPTSSPSSSSSSSSRGSSGSSSYYATPKNTSKWGHRQTHAAWKRAHRLKKFKEGGKNISFLTYDGTFGATDKVLGFI